MSKTGDRNQERIEALASMLLIRKFEEQAGLLYAAGKGPMTCTSIGQEAAAVGVIQQLGPEDLLLTNHRSAGHLLARGADPARIMAEILGREDGYCKGKSGSLHISVKELGVLLTSTIVGGELSLVPGVALALAMGGSSAVTACFFGDGAACEGVFHESLNLAAIWQLPVLYVCENNQWQALVNRRETMLTDHISEWARPYGIDALTVDGNDVDAVAAAAHKAVEYVRTQRKPFFLETYTYRLRGHMESDDQAYVNPDEIASWLKRDPIARLQSELLASGALRLAELEALKNATDRRIQEATEFAFASPYPSFSELTTDVYA